MVTIPTVLILGAGASSMYGFPLGSELKQNIIQRLSQEGTALYEQYSLMGFEQTLVKKFRDALKQSGVKSIDAFLEHRKEFIEIGKTVIAEVLIPNENESNLFNSDSDWYGYLLDRLNSSPENFDKNKLTILTFNYDRSLEWYMFNAFQARYGLTKQDAIQVFNFVPVIHLYGSLGNLPWEEDCRPYSPLNDRPNIYLARDKIKIIHENIIEDTEFN